VIKKMKSVNNIQDIMDEIYSTLPLELKIESIKFNNRFSNRFEDICEAETPPFVTSDLPALVPASPLHKNRVSMLSHRAHRYCWGVIM